MLAVLVPPCAAGKAGGGTAATGKCDMCGASATYAEAIAADGAVPTRTITANGCPNHYAVCTGKVGPPGCAAVGAEGTDTEAEPQDHVVVVPAYPVLAGSPAANECELGRTAIALNGVSIFNGAVNQQCALVDTGDPTSEWTSFDLCSGHAASGNYHYHFPPSCLLAQAEQTNPTADGHSPQIGWSLDGFPIYGPRGPGGAMRAAAELDACGGKAEELPGLDHFRYRYYFTGNVSNLYALPGYPMPDGATHYPFAQACLVGCTVDELAAGTAARCVGAQPGTTAGYAAAPHAGYTARYGLRAPGGQLAPPGAVDSGTALCRAGAPPPPAPPLRFRRRRRHRFRRRRPARIDGYWPPSRRRPRATRTRRATAGRAPQRWATA